MNTINEIQLIYTNDLDSTIKITSSKSAYELIIANWNMNTIQLQEEFKALFLNRANNVLGIYHMSKGGVAGTVVDVKLILAAALKSNASAIIIAHNHPSGNLNSSSQDRALTKKIKKATSYLDLDLLDHLIITKQGYFSFVDAGLL